MISVVSGYMNHAQNAAVSGSSESQSVRLLCSLLCRSDTSIFFAAM